MILGIISDTHNRLPGIDQALEIFRQQHASVLIHCGDWTTIETMAYLAASAAATGLRVYGVLGNRDDQAALATHNRTLSSKIDLPADNELWRLELDGCRLAVYHGHHKPTLRRLEADNNIDVLCTGHSHKPLLQQADGKQIINPGSTAFSIPRRREPRTVATFDTTSRQAQLHYFEL
jgi:putative phosphoesterase